MNPETGVEDPGSPVRHPYPEGHLDSRNTETRVSVPSTDEWKHTDSASPWDPVTHWVLETGPHHHQTSDKTKTL